MLFRSESWEHDFGSPPITLNQPNQPGQPSQPSQPAAPRLNVVRHRDFNGRFTVTEHDSLGRVVRRAPAGHVDGVNDLPPTQATPVLIDYTASGRRKSMSDASGRTDYAYDDWNRLRVKSHTRTGALYYDYDNAGRILSISARHGYTPDPDHPERFTGQVVLNRPEGAYMAYHYDARNRLDSVYDNPMDSLPPDSGPSLTPEARYAYNALGSLHSVQYRNRVRTGYTYNRLTHLERVDTTRLPSDPADTTPPSWLATFLYDDPA